MVTMPTPELALAAPSDAAVIGRVRAGDRDAFAVLVARYRARCVRLARRLLGDPDDADDAVQDAFVRAFRSLDSYQDRDRFAAWLLCIVANRCHSSVDGARRRARLAGEWLHAQQLVADAARCVERDHALAARLDAALATLPAPTREVVLQRYADELTYEEIAARSGAGISALKMRAARGSAELRRALAAAGVTVAAVALLVVAYAPRSQHARPATVVACDTLRAIMRDTLAPSVRDSLLARPGRCGDDTTLTDPRRARIGRVTRVEPLDPRGL